MSHALETAHCSALWQVKLVPDDHPGVMEAKWAAMRFTPFLVGAEPTESARASLAVFHELIGSMKVDAQGRHSLLTLPGGRAQAGPPPRTEG